MIHSLILWSLHTYGLGLMKIYRPFLRLQDRKDLIQTFIHCGMFMQYFEIFQLWYFFHDFCYLFESPEICRLKSAKGDIRAYKSCLENKFKILYTCNIKLETRKKDCKWKFIVIFNLHIEMSKLYGWYSMSFLYSFPLFLHLVGWIFQ